MKKFHLWQFFFKIFLKCEHRRRERKNPPGKSGARPCMIVENEKMSTGHNQQYFAINFLSIAPDFKSDCAKVFNVNSGRPLTLRGLKTLIDQKILKIKHFESKLNVFLIKNQELLPLIVPGNLNIFLQFCVCSRFL